MIAKVRDGDVENGAAHLSECLFGEVPTREQRVVAGLLAWALNDLHTIASGKQYKE